MLVLDNLEQIDGAGEPIAELLRAVPSLTILGTSRVILGLEGEVVHPLRGLDPPSDERNRGEGVQAAGHSDAVQLFIEAASRMVPAYDPAPSELEGIVRICRATGGMPLAIELAAQWVRVLRAADIADEIERDLHSLTRRGRGENRRHESVRTVFDHSWAKLDDRHRHALVSLSVFSGEFTSAHARHVAGIDAELLLELLDRSFLEPRGAGRIGQHPLVRTYIRERGSEHPEIVECARHAHANRYATLSANWSEKVFREGDRDALRDLDAEIEDVRVAWRFAVRERRWDWIEAMLPAMNRYHGNRRLLATLLELVEDALQVVPEDEPVWQRLMQTLVCQRVMEGRHEQAISAANEAMDTLRARAEPWRRASVLCWTGVAHAKMGRQETAARIWHEALAVPGVEARPRLVGRLLANLSFVAIDAEEADRLFERGVRKAREEDSALEPNWMLRNQSIHVLRTYGRYPEAQRIAAEAVDLVRGFAEGNVVTALQNLAYEQMMGGFLPEAEGTLREADALTQRLSEPRRGIASTENIHLRGHLLADRGTPEAALELCRAHLMGSDNNVHRLLLARLHLETGRADQAAEVAAELAHDADRQDGIRGRQYMTIMADLFSADAARMQADIARACVKTVEALERAAEHTFVPAILHGLVVAADLADERRRQRFLSVARLHPASSHETRARATRNMKDPEAVLVDVDRSTAFLLAVVSEAIEGLPG
jgi:tetratricopeptide (TPR) repeat protein